MRTGEIKQVELSPYSVKHRALITDRSGSKPPHILNLVNTRKGVVSCKPRPLYPGKKRALVGGHQRRSGTLERRKPLCPCQELPSAHNLVSAKGAIPVASNANLTKAFAE